MKKNIFIFISGIFFIFLFVFIIVFNNRNNFEIRIKAEFENVSVEDINNNFAEKIKDRLIELKEINKVVLFSKENTCSVYCKINPFVINKKQAIEKVQRKILFNKDEILYPNNIEFDDMYNKKYDTFLVISTQSLDNDFFNNYSEEILDRLNNLKITSKILKLGELKKAVYINFDDNTLLTYNINLSDIKNIIKNNNSIENSFRKNNDKNFFLINTDDNIKSVFDVGNIAIYFKGKKFSIKLSQVFNIEQKIKEPFDYAINFDDKKAQIFAISKKRCCLNFIYNYKLKKLARELSKNSYNVDFDIINTSELGKIEIFLDNNSNIYKTFEFSKKIDELIKSKNIIYFIGQEIPKISKNEIYFENDKNKLVILAKKREIKTIKKILKENNIVYLDKNYIKIYLHNQNIKLLEKKILKTKEFLDKDEMVLNYINQDTFKVFSINYIIDPYSLNDIGLSKKEVFDTILASGKGVICDYFFENSKKIPIILKNKNQSNRMFILNKNTKILATIDSIVDTEIKNEYCGISIENDEYFSVFYVNLKNKNLFEKYIFLNKLKNL